MSAIILCRCCGKPVETAPQKGFRGNDLTILTCWNKADKCDLYGVTSTTIDYDRLDVSLYKWKESTWRK